jgi:catechol 2,3-dioxygenase-like lactoylglutathione lyase family enzyme
LTRVTNCTSEIFKEAIVILGAHMVIYSKDAEKDRNFFRDVLGFGSVDAGDGWLIFGVPAGEVAFHPGAENNRHEMYLLCDDLTAEMAMLVKKGASFGEIREERWGRRTSISLPGGGEIGLYEPRHPTAFGKAG